MKRLYQNGLTRKLVVMIDFILKHAEVPIILMYI